VTGNFDDVIVHLLRCYICYIIVVVCCTIIVMICYC
jgi:hypothetical protein